MHATVLVSLTQCLTRPLLAVKETVSVEVNDLNSFVVNQQVIAEVKVMTLDRVKSCRNGYGDCVIGNVTLMLSSCSLANRYELVGATMHSFRDANDNYRISIIANVTSGTSIIAPIIMVIT